MKRRETRTARIGNVLVGGDNPIVIQSMTVADTNDIAASTAEVIALARAGAQIVRLTVPSVKAAESCREIRDRVRAAGVDVPLVADIHYTPNAAMLAAGIVDKVRVNPGNYFDRPGRGRSHDDADFATGAARVRERFGPLVEKLKANGAALRVGVNHGSLSGRMTAEYGDTPNGMVQSAIEYLEVCERLDFRDVVVSLKASIPAVTVAANRLFAEEVDKRGWKTPLHVGVTEAGMGEEGRIRSASGIGTLLSEGIGDTIRVSLTENPVHEIPAAREILRIAGSVVDGRPLTGRAAQAPERAVAAVACGDVTIGPGEPFAVIASEPSPAGGDDPPPDVVLGEHATFARADDDAALATAAGSAEPVVVVIAVDSLADIGPRLDAVRERLGGRADVLCGVTGVPAIDAVPALEVALHERAIAWPQLLVAPSGDATIMQAVIESSPPLLDNLTHAIHVPGSFEPGEGTKRAWDILQATRRRITRVEYISCPSCGRTLFDLEEVTKRISSRTDHLKDVKIAVMGCIVNGPGEMADADFGYVGSGPGKIDLYVGHERVTKNIPEDEAVDKLVELIQEHGRWVEPVA